MKSDEIPGLGPTKPKVRFKYKKIKNKEIDEYYKLFESLQIYACWNYFSKYCRVDVQEAYWDKLPKELNFKPLPEIKDHSMI